ncbi:hypothetical protein N7462_006398 [Penicillium macrosclerotiorum]|uniref:uncharacterized protein n=1 Tax=Penicillium macrosclerotiorum TaxID=303699 RepID=UPI00254810A3|nr:uncharacterized protein N7462_006398 [Penicillium macrosclerotiorum]KAJ5683233.1 hypothetical protein N7462_006398 [Penicillium macrosclerotiorum]
MQLSRTAYRAAIFHLSVNPIFARAVLTNPWAPSSLASLPQTPSSRLYTVFFPQCAPQSPILETIRQSHNMSTSNSNATTKQGTTEPQTQEENQNQSPQERLSLPSADSSSDGEAKQIRLDLGAEGGVTLDHLGPMVVNVDGSLSRIGNWEQMAEIERKNTLRILGKRNKQRLEALRAAEAEKDQK